jgi:hypothetical protein
MTLDFANAVSNRRSFIGGSDARIIMGTDEAALLRLWRQKRGEIEPEDLSDDLLVQLGTATEHLNRHWYEKNTGHLITEVQRRVFHNIHRWMAATLDGRIEAIGAVFEAKFMLPWNFSEEGAAVKQYGATAAQHVGHRLPDRGALDHCRRRQMGGNYHSGRPALPALALDRRAEILALRGDRGAPSPVRHRTAATKG